jgi:hypothetical protein
MKMSFVKVNFIIKRLTFFKTFYLMAFSSN